MKVIGKDRTSCDVCNPIDEILARLDALERRASAIVAKVQGIAPDGEGNVTLPTSSSDTDPLHGRIDAFAMSSEVKEAADDAHAYAASIADDVLVINSEIDALNQAVEVLQPAEIEAIKSAVQTLQTTVATLESTVATLNNSVEGKVSKSGDTMSGELIANGGVRSDFVRKLQSDGQNVALLLFEETETSNTASLNARKTTGTDTAIYSILKLFANSDGTYYATLTSNYIGQNDNSDKILTIKMVNSLPSLVHTTGNETISGVKTFTSTVNINGGDGSLEMTGRWPYIDLHRDNRADLDYTARIWNDLDGRLVFTVKNVATNLETDITILSTSDSKRYVTIPTTPNDAVANEITTANWVIARINELATKNGLVGL